MTKWSFFVAIVFFSLLLFLRLRAVLWVFSGCLLVGGLIFSLRCYVRSRPVSGAVAWTAILSIILFLLGVYLPDIRIWELLYL